MWLLHVQQVIFVDLPSQQQTPTVAWCRAFMCKGRAIMFWLLCCTLAFYCSRGYLCRAWPPSVSEMHSHVLALGAGCVAASSKPAFPPPTLVIDARFFIVHAQQAIWVAVDHRRVCSGFLGIALHLIKMSASNSFPQIRDV